LKWEREEEGEVRSGAQTKARATSNKSERCAEMLALDIGGVALEGLLEEI
jgi:hypothetical protein